MHGQQNIKKYIHSISYKVLASSYQNTRYHKPHSHKIKYLLDLLLNKNLTISPIALIPRHLLCPRPTEEVAVKFVQ